MRLVPIDFPVRIIDSVTGFVCSFPPFKNLNKKSCEISNGTTQIADHTQNGFVSKEKKYGTVLDAAIERRLFPVEFEWTGPGEHVYITGTFYNWILKIPLNKKSNKFYARIDLPKGRHEFKFVVNGVWKTSFRYPTTRNSYGESNNYVEI